jgi:diguanylate cyclase (GGDEF)-like protein
MYRAGKDVMRGKLPTKITQLLVSAILVTVLVVGSVIVWMAAEHNRQAARNSQTMVAGGVAALGQTLRTITLDYTSWGEAWRNVVDRNDRWVDKNVRTAVFVARTMDLFLVVQPDGTIQYSWNNKTVEAPVRERFPAELARDMLNRLDKVPPSQSALFETTARIGDDIYLLAASRFMPDNIDVKRNLPLPGGIFGLRLNAERLASLGKSFLVDDLKLSPPGETAQLSHVLRDAKGAPVAQLEWTPPYPGDVLLHTAVLPVAGVLLIFIFSGVIVAAAAHKTAADLARSESNAYATARRDALTGLANRLHFHEVISSSAVRSACASGEFGIVYIDLNDFKNINDSIGHSGGDELVKIFARRLDQTLGPTCLVARIGGDEFVVLVQAPAPLEAARQAAGVVIAAMAEDLTVFSRPFRITASVGYAVADADRPAPDEILRRADLAMYEAKKTRSREPVLYVAEHDLGLHKNAALNEALASALAADELEVHYQPIVGAQSGQLEVVEALVRWRSPSLGQMSPATFIPVAEQSGLIEELGDFVFRRVLDDMSRVAGLKVSINVSPVQLRASRFVGGLLKLVETASIQPFRIQIELTEGILVTDPTGTRRKLLELREHGFDVALDDFGIGYSSIGYLRDLPFSTLKIDRSFVSGLKSDAQAADLLLALTSLGRALNLRVVAEGVETAEEAQLLKLSGCHQLQGYYFSRAVPLEELCRRYDLPLRASAGARRKPLAPEAAAG